MLWCPKCKCEYREGFTNCSDCGSELLEMIEYEKEENKEITENDIEVFLISVSQDFDAKIIQSKLTSFGIPSLKKCQGIDGIYGFTGTSSIDIYVPSKLLDNARDLIDTKIK
ncbi:hypothetical protein [Clostridium sp.]|uniref:hypothetical protein n=1 Tax=Clostridium sp. TaxID=1506 RepID=UPI001A3F4BF1|nr:hypothetical protein [Clostridium sp.]MBK5242990.1 hypothetical protein [Clostridium sp.]